MRVAISGIGCGEFGTGAWLGMVDGLGMWNKWKRAEATYV